MIQTMMYEGVAREQPRLVIQEDGTLTLRTNNLPDVNVPQDYILLVSSHPASGSIVVTVVEGHTLFGAVLAGLNKQGTTDPISQL